MKLVEKKVNMALMTRNAIYLTKAQYAEALRLYPDCTFTQTVTKYPISNTQTPYLVEYGTSKRDKQQTNQQTSKEA